MAKRLQSETRPADRPRADGLAFSLGLAFDGDRWPMRRAGEGSAQRERAARRTV